ncbi:MAG: allantoicase [Porticoccaceae bacterium]|nr:allantoicase [Porticoccaceae bacterium]
MNNNQDHNDKYSSKYIDLASERVGGRAIGCSDEWFANCSNLVKPGRGVFKEGYFVDTGQWMDGWESRRSFGRSWRLNSDENCDWCEIRLGIAGVIKGFDIDTHFFRGNAPDTVLVEAANIDNEEDGNIQWTEILAKSTVQPHNQNLFDCQSTKVWTHVRLKIFPDGGVARFRVYGEAQLQRENFIDGELIDLASVIHGGRGISASDMFFSSPSNLIMPNRGCNMGDGWETKRRRDNSNDWAVIKLALSGTIRKVILDTAHFKGNYPDQFSLQGARSNNGDSSSLTWQTIIEKTPLRADYEHLFIQQLLCAKDDEFTHVKVNIYPDGGISRLRIFGFPNWGSM